MKTEELTVNNLLEVFYTILNVCQPVTEYPAYSAEDGVQRLIGRKSAFFHYFCPLQSH